VNAWKVAFIVLLLLNVVIFWWPVKGVYGKHTGLATFDVFGTKRDKLAKQATWDEYEKGNRNNNKDQAGNGEQAGAEL